MDSHGMPPPSPLHPPDPPRRGNFTTLANISPPSPEPLEQLTNTKRPSDATPPTSTSSSTSLAPADRAPREATPRYATTKQSPPGNHISDTNRARNNAVQNTDQAKLPTLENLAWTSITTRYMRWSAGTAVRAVLTAPDDKNEVSGTGGGRTVRREVGAENRFKGNLEGGNRSQFFSVDLV